MAISSAAKNSSMHGKACGAQKPEFVTINKHNTVLFQIMKPIIVQTAGNKATVLSGTA